MDRQALAERNNRLAEALRQRTAKQKLRDKLLAALARMPIPASGAGSGRLLIIRPDHLGDALLSTPAIQAIKRRHPRLSIHALCGPWSAPALAHYAEIDQILTIDFPGFQRPPQPPHNAWQLAWHSARHLRRIGYASAIVMRHDHWWGALVAYLAGIQERFGYDIASVAPLLSHAQPFEHQHAVLQNMRLARRWTGEMTADEIQLRFPVQDNDRHVIDGKLGEWGMTAAELVCIHPGAGMRSKLWHAGKWARVADQLVERHDVSLVFTGTRGEANLIDAIMARMTTGRAIKAGETTVGELAALYERSRAVLGADSGALHLAAAVNAPTVALFGPADPLEFAPWGDPGRHIALTAEIGCRPCRILDWASDDPAWHPCVGDISIEQTLHAAETALSQPTGSHQRRIT